MRILNSSVV